MNVGRDDTTRVSNNHIHTHFIIWRLGVEIDTLFLGTTILESGNLKV